MQLSGRRSFAKQFTENLRPLGWGRRNSLSLENFGTAPIADVSKFLNLNETAGTHCVLATILRAQPFTNKAPIPHIRRWIPTNTRVRMSSAMSGPNLALRLSPPGPHHEQPEQPQACERCRIRAITNSLSHERPVCAHEGTSAEGLKCKRIEEASER